MWVFCMQYILHSMQYVVCYYSSSWIWNITLPYYSYYFCSMHTTHNIWIFRMHGIFKKVCITFCAMHYTVYSYWLWNILAYYSYLFFAVCICICAQYVNFPYAWNIKKICITFCAMSSMLVFQCIQLLNPEHYTSILLILFLQYAYCAQYVSFLYEVHSAQYVICSMLLH